MNIANKRLLVIDDDKSIWKAYQDILAPDSGPCGDSSRELASILDEAPDTPGQEEPPFALHFASQGQAGYQLVQQALAAATPFSVAFIDIRMPPGWDGMETATRIRQIDPDIEIVIVTAFTDRTRAEIVLSVGSPDKLLYLRKPFDPEELAQIALSLSAKWLIGRREKHHRRELQTVLQTTPAAIFTVDGNRIITSWNPAAEKITGFPANEVIGKSCLMDSITPEGCPHCFASGQGVSLFAIQNKKLRITTRDGRQRTIIKSASPFSNDKGDHQMAVESFWDITAMEETEAALHASESRLRSLIETTSDWVWEMSVDGIFTYCSPVCEAVYGYGAEELLGRNIYETLLVPEEVATFQAIIAECIEKWCEFQRFERKSRRKDGSIGYIESSGVPVFEKGAVTGFRGIDRDVSQRKAQEEEQRKLEAQYRQSQKMEALGTLAGGIAHDLNNILTPIMGCTQLSLMRLEDSAGVADNLRIIEKSAAKAAELIRQILTFSRKQVLVIKSLNLNTLIDNFTRMLTRLIRENITLQVELAEDLWAINGDSGQMEQILINLVVNSRDAISGSGTILIRTENRTLSGEDALFDVDQRPLLPGEYAVMTVRDTGSGIQEEEISKIFEPFHTTKEAGKGTGIGLSTVYGIVLQHSAQITVQSRPGEGASFAIFFPRTMTQQEPFPAEASMAAVQGGDETLLVVEDNSEVRLVTKFSLEHYGYTVFDAACGEDGLAILKEQNTKIDLLVTDVVMPGFGGRDLARAARSLHPQLPVLFMSGHTFDIDPGALTVDERSHFMQKPFTPRDLAKKVRGIFNDVKKETP